MSQEALLSLFQPPKIDEIKKILCIQPHPDDNEIGMGGIISYLTSKGVQVDYLTVTDGSLGDIGIIEGDLKEIRRNEAINAGKLLGVKEFFFLEHLDGELNDVPSLAREIATIIRQNNYDSIASPDPFNSYEAHYDHIVTGRAAAQAAISVNLKEYPRGTTTKSVNLNSVLFYFTQRPNSLIDITNHFEKKMAATALHKSQITPELLNLYTSYFAYRGMQLSGSDKIFEGVKALLPLHLHCIPEAINI